MAAIGCHGNARAHGAWQRGLRNLLFVIVYHARNGKM